MVAKWIKFAAIWLVAGLFTATLLTLLYLGESVWLADKGQHLTVTGAIVKSAPRAALGSLWGIVVTYFIEKRSAKRSR